ncbi:hypothetical protein FKB34_00035 [Glycocaulis profundi]|nr:hypothetical protein FKB34_00035 [Glycocaulis profundi]
MSLTRAETERLREAGLRDDVIAAVEDEAGRMRLLWLRRSWLMQAVLVLALGAAFMLLGSWMIRLDAPAGLTPMVFSTGIIAVAARRLVWLRAHPDRAGARRLIVLAVRGRSATLERLAWEISRKADPHEALALISGAPRLLSDAELGEERASHMTHLKAFGLTAALLAGVGALFALAWLIGRP